MIVDIIETRFAKSAVILTVGLAGLMAENAAAELPEICTRDGAGRLVGDLNNDGRSDLLCYDASGAKWVGIHDGIDVVERWSDSSLRWCIHPDSRLLLGDVNRDGRADLICKDPNRVWIDYASDNFFQGMDFYFDTHFCTHAGSTLVVHDVNGDGYADLDCATDDGTHQVDLADTSDRFGAVDCTGGENIRAPFLTSRRGMVVETSGEMSISTLSNPDDHDYRCVWTIGSNPFFGAVYVSAWSTRLGGELYIEGPPFVLGYAQTGAAVRLEVRTADTSRRPLCSDDHLLNERETPATFGALRDGLGESRLLACKTERYQGEYETSVCLRSWSTAVGGLVAAASAQVRVDYFRTLNCFSD